MGSLHRIALLTTREPPAEPSPGRGAEAASDPLAPEPAEAGAARSNGTAHGNEVGFAWLIRAADQAADFRRLADLAPQGLFVHRGGRLLYANAAALELFQAPREDDLVGLPLGDLVAPQAAGVIAELVRQGREDPAPRTIQLDGIVFADGRRRDLEVSVATAPWQGEPARCALVRDVSARREMERALRERESQLRLLAFRDPLTGLANRALFMDRLEHAVRRARRHRVGLAVLFLDLDRFKVVNDSLGHAAGDRLLQQVGQRLAGCLRASDTVARLGGDEFGALLEEVDEPGQAIEAAARILADLFEPVEIDGTRIQTHPSIGVAYSSRGAERPRDLLRFADVAMYRAKREGSHYRLFDRAEDAAATERLQQENALREALATGQLTLHYQPVVSLPSGAVVGAEALVRWNHPRHGLLLPGEFIPLAEESGLIAPLGEWVLAEACRQGAEWIAGLPPGDSFTLSVNLSARQLLDPDLAELVQGVLAATGMEPARLLLELTENALVQAPERAWELRELGVRLAIDDFGTGYASLAYLKKLPVSVLKVDRSFTGGLGHDPADAALVRTILFMARNLGLRVVAEGIETEAHVRHLCRFHCPLAQGYFFGRPAPAPALGERLREGRRRPPEPLPAGLAVRPFPRPA